MTVRVEGLSKAFGRVPALRDVTFDARDQELLVVIGPSGSGKTTLLRCIAGLDEPDAGRIEVGDRDVTEFPPGDRDVAMVFQEYALYPHLDAAGNIGFGLRARGVNKEEARSKVEFAAALLSIEDCLDRPPSALSGGERQRVALARAIVREPAAFLMDEPLSNLDAELRTKMRAELRSLQRRLETTMVYVTHDQTEAFTLGDRVVVLNAGTVAQIGTPRELYEAPASTFVARSLGTPPMNLLPTELQPGPDGAAAMGVRPERVRLVPPPSGRLKGVVRAVEQVGGQAIVHVNVSGEDLLATSESWDAHAIGQEVGLDFADSDLYAFGPDGTALR